MEGEKVRHMLWTDVSGRFSSGDNAWGVRGVCGTPARGREPWRGGRTRAKPRLSVNYNNNLDL